MDEKKVNRDLLEALKRKQDIRADAISPIQKKRMKQAAQKKITSDTVFALYEEGLSIEEIACRLDVSAASIAQIFARLIKRGYAVDIKKLIDHDTLQEIIDAFYFLNTSSVKKISDYVSPHIAESDIRIVRAFLQYQHRDGE